MKTPSGVEDKALEAHGETRDYHRRAGGVAGERRMNPPGAILVWMDALRQLEKREHILSRTEHKGWVKPVVK